VRIERHVGAELKDIPLESSEWIDEKINENLKEEEIDMERSGR
jgi:hypothetical protein